MYNVEMLGLPVIITEVFSLYDWEALVVPVYIAVEFETISLVDPVPALCLLLALLSLELELIVEVV